MEGERDAAQGAHGAATALLSDMQAQLVDAATGPARPQRSAPRWGLQSRRGIGPARQQVSPLGVVVG